MTKNYLKIQIDGKDVGLKFGFPQVKEFGMAIADNYEVYFDGNDLSATGVAKLIHTAHRNSCLVKECDPVVSFEDIVDWVDGALNDEERQKVIGSVIEMWQANEYTKLWLQAVKKKTAEIIDQMSSSNTNISNLSSTQQESPEGS